MKLFLCILTLSVMVHAGCTSRPPAQPAEEETQESEKEDAAQEAVKKDEAAVAKPEVSRVAFVRQLAETAVKGDSDALRKMFVPLDVIVEMRQLMEKPIGEEEMEEATKSYGERIDSLIRRCLLCFKKNDPKSLRYEGIGMSEFAASEKREIESLKAKGMQMTDHGDVQVFSDTTRIIGARVFRYKGAWYFVDVF